MSKLALFDFDGTITTKDSFIEFIKYTKGTPALVIGFIIMSPILILMKMGFVANWKAKEMVMKYFWSGTDVETFNEKGVAFGKEKIPTLCRPGAIDKIEFYKKEGWRVVMVSASVTNWLKNWTANMNIELLATELQVKEGKITGKIDGFNCYGPEKVNRLHELLNIKEYSEIHAFGDSKGDREMLALSNKPFYKPFRS